tara:strand:- start:5461 stop:6264 length:804 start_codon:yes stop_codon:yes gene_type:complete
MSNKITIGSLFAGIGGFELGIERAIPNSKTIWQVEQNTFCQSILSKHWPKAKIYDDVRDITVNNVEPVDILIGGFPCQDISIQNNQAKGIHNGKKSSLWWEMHRIIRELQPRIVIMENVANILRVGGLDVVGSLAEIGYECEWTVIQASDFGACHQRARWFCVAYPRCKTPRNGAEMGIRMEKKISNGCQGLPALWNNKRESDWGGVGSQSAICRVDDGLPTGMDRSKHNKIRQERLRALGNAIVPQCSEWIGLQVLKSGLLDNLID